MELTHLNEQGRAHMVDVSAKERTMRVARAAGKVLMRPDTLELVRSGGAKKGDVLAVAQVAGIMAAKRCWELVPMCHPIQLTGVDVSFAYEPDGIAIEAVTRCCGETGVEMEALAAVSVAGLTVYDMCKSVQRDMVVDAVRLLEKDGGKSGHFVREATKAVPCGRVRATCVSERKGTRKHEVDSIELQVGVGIVGDAHAGAWHRQVSLLPDESVDRMRTSGLDLSPGDFAENILTVGMDLRALPIGTTLAVGPVRLVVTQIGKTCHNDCEIRRLTGSCVMPTDGIFAIVTHGGTVRAGDGIVVVPERVADALRPPREVSDEAD